MIRTLLRDEKPLFALLSANGILASVHKFFLNHQPELTSFLTVLQIIIALITLFHFGKKYAKHLIDSQKEQ